VAFFDKYNDADHACQDSGATLLVLDSQDKLNHLIATGILSSTSL